MCVCVYMRVSGRMQGIDRRSSGSCEGQGEVAAARGGGLGGQGVGSRRTSSGRWRTGLRTKGDYVDATEGFAAVSEDMGSDPERVMRMLGPDGNPPVANLAGVLASLTTHGRDARRDRRRGRVGSSSAVDWRYRRGYGCKEWLSDTIRINDLICISCGPHLHQH